MKVDAWGVKRQVESCQRVGVKLWCWCRLCVQDIGDTCSISSA